MADQWLHRHFNGGRPNDPDVVLSAFGDCYLPSFLDLAKRVDAVLADSLPVVDRASGIAIVDAMLNYAQSENK